MSKKALPYKELKERALNVFNHPANEDVEAVWVVENGEVFLLKHENAAKMEAKSNGGGQPLKIHEIKRADVSEEKPDTPAAKDKGGKPTAPKAKEANTLDPNPTEGSGYQPDGGSNTPDPASTTGAKSTEVDPPGSPDPNGGGSTAPKANEANTPDPHDTDGNGKLSAAERVTRISKAATVEDVQELLKGERASSVKKAGVARIDELNK